MVSNVARLFYELTVGGFILSKQLLKNGQSFRGYNLYYKGMRAGIQIGIQLEKDRQNNTPEVN